MEITGDCVEPYESAVAFRPAGRPAAMRGKKVCIFRTGERAAGAELVAVLARRA